MPSWTAEELALIGGADEVQVASVRRDGTLRSDTTIWIVRVGDALYVRSVNGRAAAWFRGTQVRHAGRLRAAGRAFAVAFAAADEGLHDAIDAAYRTKYRRYSARFVDPTVTPLARGATLKLVPRPHPRDDQT